MGQSIDSMFHADLIHEPDHNFTCKSLIGTKENLGMDCTVVYYTFTETPVFDEGLFVAHSHEVDEVLTLVAGNPGDISDFDAEMEVCIGKEKRIVTEPTVLTLPAGTVHNVLIKKVNKPMVMWTVLMEPKENA